MNGRQIVPPLSVLTSAFLPDDDNIIQSLPADVLSVPELEAHYKDYYGQEVGWTFAMLGSGHASMWTACCFGQCFVFCGIRMPVFLTT